MHYYAMNS